MAYAHGQMKEHELERIMFDFINGEIDVLVSTTIIETGLDISNVNTMIIHDSDNLGLSQLYQLRGRVGRSNRNAYAFLMYKRDKMLKERRNGWREKHRSGRAITWRSVGPGICYWGWPTWAVATSTVLTTVRTWMWMQNLKGNL